MTQEEYVDQIRTISRAIHNAAWALYENAHDLLAANKISQAQFNDIFTRYYQPADNMAFRIMENAAGAVLDNAQESIDAVTNGIAVLNNASQEIEKTEKVADAFVHLISVAASVAAFAGAPSLTTANTVKSAVSGFIDSLS